MHGNGQFMAGIPVQSTAPSASGYKYWYDTSGTQVVLKMSDGIYHTSKPFYEISHISNETIIKKFNLDLSSI